MRKLDSLAADIMDLYYQDFPDADESFFTREFFERMVLDGYASLLQSVYNRSYELLRADNKHKTSMVVFDSELLTKEEVEVKEGKVTLKHRVMSFLYDQSGCAIQDVQGDCDFIRIRYFEKHKLKLIENGSEVFWWAEPSLETTELNFSKSTNAKANIYYLPSGDNTVQVGDSAADDIKRNVLALLWEAKKGGYPPDEINDGSKTVKQEQGQ